jgi:hypothetical protein
MWSANVIGANDKRPARIVSALQSLKNAINAASANPRHIFCHHPLRLNFLNKTDELKKQPGSFAIDPFSFRVSRAGVLAGGASSEDVDRSDSVAAEPFGGNISNVSVHFDVREVLEEALLPPLVDLARSDRAESRSFEAERPAAARSAKRIEDIHLGPRSAAGFGRNLSRKAVSLRATLTPASAAVRTVRLCSHSTAATASAATRIICRRNSDGPNGHITAFPA